MAETINNRVYSEAELDRMVESAKEAYVAVRRAEYPTYRLSNKWSEEFWLRVVRRAIEADIPVTQFVHEVYHAFVARYGSLSFQPNMLTSGKLSVRKNGAKLDLQREADDAVMRQLELVRQIAADGNIADVLSGRVGVNPLVFYWVVRESGTPSEHALSAAVSFVRERPAYRAAAERILPSEAFQHV
jgi:hypothetical protein